VPGRVAPGFEIVADAFGDQLAGRGDLGASFAATLDGATVVDLWGGVADRSSGAAWAADTLVPIFSGTKGLVATCLLVLLDRGLLELDCPVYRYWPEFAAQGKDDVLVRHVVSHTAGLPGLTTAITAEEATDAARVAALLAAQPAITPPGRRLCYHALTFGWLCDGLVRRVDGRSIGTFFADEVAAPLGLEAWIGLPGDRESRVATITCARHFVVPAGDRDEDPIGWSIWQNPRRFGVDPLPANSRAWHEAELPATSAVASARAMARLYGCLARGGEIDGIRLVAPETVARGRQCLARGDDPYLASSMAFGVGFQLQTPARHFGPEAGGFGHGGTGGSVHGAWPEQAVGFSYAMNLLRNARGADPRPAALLDALHAAVTQSR
jgi:CubicO group peptidase (beta-lactamase class C family)